MHPGPLRPHGRPRRKDRRARRRRRRCTRPCRSSTRARSSPDGHPPSPPASRSPPGADSRRRTPCPTSAASAPRCSPTPARCSTTSWPHPSDPTTRTTRCGCAGQRGVRPRTSGNSPGGSAALSGTATGRPRASSSSVATPSMPEGALGIRRADTVLVIDPETGVECPPVTGSTRAGARTNLEEAVGEIVETAGRPRASRATTGTRRPPAARFRDGWYWSGDLAYRDAEGWLYFAGRSNEWLRVDGENFAAAPGRGHHRPPPDVRSVAVYAVPDDPVGDRVMVAVELARRHRLRPGAFDAFLDDQPDLGPKWMPAFVRVDRRAAQAGQHEDRQDSASGARPGGRARCTGVPARAKRCAL